MPRAFVPYRERGGTASVLNIFGNHVYTDPDQKKSKYVRSNQAPIQRKGTDPGRQKQLSAYDIIKRLYRGRGVLLIAVRVQV